MRRTWLTLAGEPVTAIYSSPSRRAVESAGLRTPGTPAATIDDRLREIDFGEFEGLTYEDIAKKFPERYRQWMSQPTEVSFPGGENFRALSARVLEAVADFELRHRHGTIVIVSHGGVNRVVLAAALELDCSRIFRIDQDYASVSVIDRLGDEPLVRLINMCGPLPC